MSTTEETNKAPARRTGKAVISVEGLIGGGKTTLIEALVSALRASGLKAVYVPEPVEEWKRVHALQRFYESAAKEARASAAYEFQTFTFTTRINATLRAVEAAPDADVFVTERTVLTDRFVFMELQRELVGPDLMEMYEEFWQLYGRLMPVDLSEALYVFLKPSLEACMQRVAKRAREGEVQGKKGDATGAGGVSAEYQLRLQRAHEAFFQNVGREEFPGMPPPPFAVPGSVLVLGPPLADSDFSVDGAARDAIVAAVVDKMRAHWPQMRKGA